GGAPCFAGSAGGVWRFTAPALQVAVNPTGSGDSLVAGTLHGILLGWPFEEAVRFGVAAGAANASVWKVADSTPEEIERFLDGVKVQKVE
ncbi:MAG TPA: PfkB family carbohydrate kinase, partial [Bacteroidota bacterium]